MNAKIPIAFLARITFIILRTSIRYKATSNDLYFVILSSMPPKILVKYLIEAYANNCNGNIA